MRTRQRCPPSKWFARVGYTPHPGQQRIHDSHARYRVAVCGRRWGKSDRLAAHECELYLAPPVPNRVWIVAPTYDHADKVFRAVYNHMVMQTWRGRPVVKAYRTTPNPRLEFIWGAVLEGKSADKPTSLVGEGVDFLVVDEAAKIPRLKRIWEQYLQPTLADKRGRVLFISTPEGYDYCHKLYERGQDREQHDWASWRSPTWANTHSFPGGREDAEIVRACDTLTESYFDQEYGAEFTALTGRVYKEFQREVDGKPLHVIDAMPEGHESWTRYRSIDWGYTNPFCCLWVASDGDGRWYVYDEEYTSGLNIEDCAERVKQRGATGYYRTVADPSEPEHIAQFVRHGVSCEKAKTTKTTGIELVRQRLKVRGDGEPRLRVLSHCKHTIFEFENYRMGETRAEVNAKEEPVKKDDHAMDCLKNLALTVDAGGVWQQVR